METMEQFLDKHSLVECMLSARRRACRRCRRIAKTGDKVAFSAACGGSSDHIVA
jgi:hypothetical protein